MILEVIQCQTNPNVMIYGILSLKCPFSCFLNSLFYLISYGMSASMFALGNISTCLVCFSLTSKGSVKHYLDLR